MITEKPGKINLIVSPAPHLHSGWSTREIMYTIMIALMPAAIAGTARYGWHAARVIAAAVSAAMITETVFYLVKKHRTSLHDGSAAVTGLLLALILPPSAPWWLVVTGSSLAVIIGCLIFGGPGSNPFNPVLVAWAALRISWSDFLNFDFAMVNYETPFPIDYPLSLLKKAGTGALDSFPLSDLIIGRQTGGIGTPFGILIIAGGLLLLIRGVIPWRIPLFYLIGTAVTAAVFRYAGGTHYASPVFHCVTGTLLFGAFFLASDFGSSPVNKTATALYGFGCGALTIVLRVWSIYPDAVPFAILIMNILSPLLDKIRPKVPGKVVMGSVR